MLRWRTILAISGLVATASKAARADEDEDALRRPERITIGVKDQFLGELDLHESTLYFVSNRSTRKEIYAQNIEQGRARPAFDEGAEVTWPRISPDGKEMLYLSFRDEATGQLCVRTVPDMGNRRCLSSVPAATQAQWIDRSRIVLISRNSIHGDLRVSEVSVGASLLARPLFDRNWSSPTVSPGGRWIVYVPLDRAAKRVGPGFAARAAPRLEAMRLDGQGAPVPLAFGLPGMTAQPAFSRDGRFLYFVQFFSDSNHDGTIDAADNGVLFRVPFSLEADDAPAKAAASAPLQLTESGMNCQYPAPSQSRLITTCAHDGALDVFELPLGGEIPEHWALDRLRVEAGLAIRHSQQLLLYRDMLAHESSTTERRLLLMRLVMTHLELEEFDAAEFYAKLLAELHEPATRGLGRPMVLLVEHRRARSVEERGSAVQGSLEEARARLERLRDDPKWSPAARVLRRVVSSEIANWMGDLGRARQELEAALAAVNDETPPGVTAMLYAGADTLYRQLDDREALVTLCRHLARTRAISEEDRVNYARAAVRALVRGLPYAEADAVLVRERSLEPGDTEFGFALELGQAVLAIRSDRPGRELRTRLIRLYEAQKKQERKRAIVLDAVERAADLGADSIIEALAERYVDDVAPGTEEHRRAMRVYRRALLGRAYRRLSRGRDVEARADFEAIMRRTESFDAIVETIELRLKAGETPTAIEAGLRPLAAPAGQGPEPHGPEPQGQGRPPASSSPEGAGRDHNPWSPSRGGDREAACLANFAKAYLQARELPRWTGEEHTKMAAAARAHLRACWAELKDKGPVRDLQGTILHQEYLQTGAPEAAEKANSHYLIALELVRRNPRYLAVVLSKLGLLHTQAGNYRIALGYFQRREKLPYADPLSELAVRIAMARVLLHVERDQDAAAMAEKALALVEKIPALAGYRLLALDRAALYNLAAGYFDRSLALYDAEIPLLSSGTGSSERRNRLVVRLARAAAAAGAGQAKRCLEDLDVIDAGLEDRVLAPALTFPYTSEDVSLRSYQSIVSGLRANANQALGRLDAIGKALTRSRGLSEDRFLESNREEDARALALIEARIAANAAARRDLPAAGKWIGRALDHADAAVARRGAGAVAIDADQLQVLRLATELEVFGHAKMGEDLRRRVLDAQNRLSSVRNPTYAGHESWFEIYLAMRSLGTQVGKSNSFPRAAAP